MLDTRLHFGVQTARSLMSALCTPTLYLISIYRLLDQPLTFIRDLHAF